MQSIQADGPTYHEDVVLVARALAAGKHAFVRLVDRSTTYQLSIATLAGCFWFGEPSGPDLDRDSYWVIVGVIGHGCYWFDLLTPISATYLSEKLGVYGGDGEALAAFLTQINLAIRKGV